MQGLRPAGSVPGLAREQLGGWIIGGLGGIVGLKHRPGRAQWEQLVLR